jgi:nicotinamide-nucleotide amidase
MTVDIEIICVGNELLIGKVKDTNAHYLGKQATQLGANIKRVTVIQDIVEEIAQTINEALARKPQFIITTGGLGPTFDDKTLQGLAKALNRKLAVNPQALEMVKQRTEQYLKKRGLSVEFDMTAPRIKMARLPEGSEVVINPVGTAPSVRVDIAETSLFVLPGVPVEAEAIFDQTIAPLIRQAVGDSVFCERSLFVDNIFESRLAPLIDRVMGDNAGVYIKSHPIRAENEPHVELHLTMTAGQEQTPMEKLVKAAGELARLIEIAGGVVVSA